jgi:RimJ/RimL family protein N-acetyltransferase
VGHLFADNSGEPDPHTWSVGWHFNPQYEGQGFATASVSALFTYLFTQKEARRLYAYVEDYNLPSQKLCAVCICDRKAALRSLSRSQMNRAKNGTTLRLSMRCLKEWQARG